MLGHGETVYRLRPKLIWDDASASWVRGDWEDPDEAPIPGAFLDAPSTSTLSDPVRTQAADDMALYVDDPAADIRKGDRIRIGPDEPGAVVYTVDGIPHAPRNPFTGWQPVRKIRLTRGVG